MGNSEHTPGPWSWSENWLYSGNEIVLRYTIDDDGIHASDGDRSLIAAAPDLLTCGAALLDAAERHIFGDECKAERDAMRAAIAKATKGADNAR